MSSTHIQCTKVITNSNILHVSDATYENPDPNLSTFLKKYNNIINDEEIFLILSNRI